MSTPRPVAAPSVRTALVTLLGTLFPSPVLVSDGHPGTANPPSIVVTWDVEGDLEDVPIGAGRQEETGTIDVVFSLYQGGGPEAQPTVNAQAFTNLAILRGALNNQAGGDGTLGGACRFARVTHYKLDEPHTPDETAQGRLAELTVTITFVARV